MIPRYQRAEMAALWTDDAKWRRWLDVEIAVVNAWADEGVVPREDAELVAANAGYNVADIDRYQAEVHHDTLAFLRSVADTLGPESRWVHHGLTTSDVWDTASALQIRDAARIIEDDLERLEASITRRAVEHKHTLCIGRTHGIHGEPTTFGLKLASWVDETRRNRRRLADAIESVAVGKISGAVGTHATVPPHIEERVCRELGLGVEAISTQVVQRDRHAYFLSTLAVIAASLERFATEIRHLQRTEVRESASPSPRARPVPRRCRTSATPRRPSASADWPAQSAPTPSPRSRTSPSGTSATSPIPRPSASPSPTPASPSTTSPTCSPGSSTAS